VTDQGQDQSQQQRLTPKEVADNLRVSYVAVVKWMKYGFRGVRLRAIKAGSQYRTYQKWVDEFLAATNEPEATDERPGSDRGPSEADERLARLGM
jgi:excisionase family DNA binding protein